MDDFNRSNISTNSNLKKYLECFKNNTPGAGTYNINDQSNKRHDFSRGNSRAFQKPIIDTVDSQKEKIIPGPSHYDVTKSNRLQFRANNVCADAAFKSQTQRAFMVSKNNDYNPAPGTYEINVNLKYQSAKIPYSSFKSNSKRMNFTPPSLSDLPGPADYHPYEETQNNVNKQLMPYEI